MDITHWNSVVKAIHEPSIQYYKELSKKTLKKKKARLASLHTVTGRQSSPFGPIGWSIHYDLKLAIYAEIRGDYSAAIK